MKKMKKWDIEVKLFDQFTNSRFEIHLADRIEVSGGALVFIIEDKVVEALGNGYWISFKEIK